MKALSIIKSILQKPFMILKFLKLIWPFLLLVALTSMFYFLMPKIKGGPNIPLTETRKIAIDTVVEVNKFVISVAFIIIGFLGSILIGKLIVKRNSFDSALLYLSCIFGILAIFFGYLIYDGLVILLNNSISDMENDYIEWLRRAQFICVISSTLTFLIFIYNNSFKTEKSDKEII